MMNFKNIVSFMALVSSLGLAYFFGNTIGYRAGYDDGYSYECRAELGRVATFAHEVRKNVENVEKITKQIEKNTDVAVPLRDSLDAMMQRGVKDTSIIVNGVPGGFGTIGGVQLDSAFMKKYRAKRGVK